MSVASNRSMPAGTGVWVVNTVAARTASSASAKRQPLADQVADALEPLESGVALVGVEDLGGGHAGERGVGLHGTGAADAEQQLLQQAVLAAAAVEAVGDAAQLLRVLGDVGVEQQQADATDRRAARCAR